MRIPRKKKKRFKMLCQSTLEYKVLIQKNTIDKEGCVVYPKNQLSK